MPNVSPKGHSVKQLEYSIVIPVFNKAALTRHCLATIRPTLAGAGDGEIIVIDNASSDETPQMLAEFPWVRIVCNQTNLGFAGANNQGARLAQGNYLILLNNDIEAHPGWLAAMLAVAREPDVGAVGARLLFPNDTIQHAGVVMAHVRVGSAGFVALHDAYGERADDPAVTVRRDVQCVTGACMATPRELYLELGGLDEAFWNGYEDVDYCLKVGARGLRVVYEPAAVLTHFESQSGIQRFRRVAQNVRVLTDRWRGRVVFDRNRALIRRGKIAREIRQRGAHAIESLKTPAVTVFVHGSAATLSKVGAGKMLGANVTPIDAVVLAQSENGVAALRAEMERRGDRYLAVVDGRATLYEGWLDELVRQIEFGPNVAASTYAPELPIGEDVNPLAADGRCTLLALRQFPADLRLREASTLDGAIADLLLRAIRLRLATRGAGRAIAALPPQGHDPVFETAQGMRLPGIYTLDPSEVERRLVASERHRGLTSIVMLSWNAPQYTKLALESIRVHTLQPYEVIVIDNGSDRITTDWLGTLEDVVVIFNPSNRGFAGGCNQGMAAARGDRIVLLNNDVIVTAGWLDGLLDAFDRIPALGISAVRSNRIAGDQLVEQASYDDIESMHVFAAQRRRTYRRKGYMTDRAIGLCLCIDRRVIEEIGGIDERYGVGNFEDDDFCLRVRAAGYRIYVCDDVFIHHFGSQTFSANKIDYNKTLSENWNKFARKWGLGPLTGDGYDSAMAIAAGFDRTQHYVALPADPTAGTLDPRAAASAEPTDRSYRLAFAAVVGDERDWNEVGAFARKYARAFCADDDVLLTIAAVGSLDAATLGARVERALARDGVVADRAADIAISDEVHVGVWIETVRATRRFAVVARSSLDALEALEGQSPSQLRRHYDRVVEA
jgi:GT2 family glycosyltransferase